MIDNAADEALAGHGKRIAVTLHADGPATVDDDGRGIPFGPHPDEGAPVVELVFTRLHAGGKFDKGAGGAYSFSGGLRGVGVSVTNALARRLEVTVWRDGQRATIAFAGGDVVEPLALARPTGAERRHGTRARVWPDAKVFDTVELPRHDLMHLLRSKAVLMPGVNVSLTVERGAGKEPDTQAWLYQRGPADYLTQGLAAKPLIPLFTGEPYAGRDESENVAEREGAAWCLAFTDEADRSPLLRAVDWSSI